MSWGAESDDDPRSGDLGYALSSRLIPRPGETKLERERERRIALNVSRTSGWAGQAKKLYGNVPFPIWTIAYIGSLQDDFGGDRVTMMDLGAGLERLLKWKEESPENFANLDLDKLSRVSSGDLVIIYGTELESNLDYQATVWKVFHGIMDSGFPDKLRKWSDLEEAFGELFGHFDDPAKLMANAFTMRSARTGRKTDGGGVESADDMINEIVVQEVIDRRGFHLDEKYLQQLDEEDQEILLNLVPFVRAVGAELREKLRGKFIMVDVDTAQ
jgi:hypothetical protein